MVKGYYMMSVKPVNKAKQSAVAMASYRSGEKLYSLRDGETKKYKERFVQPENFILKPDHAPDWTLEREKLWNQVESFEKRDNSRIARNVLLPLPNDMTNEQQLELTSEYIQDNFVNKGMVADISIHRDELNNPHAHVLLTTREFDEKGNWEKRKSKRVPVLDENGQQTYNEKGWRNTRSVKLNDWDDKATLIKWRENWAEKLNEKAIKFETNKEYSHKSFEDQGRFDKAEIRLTRNEYQFEKRLKDEAEKNNKEYKPTTYYAKKNAEIKEYNEQLNKVIHLQDYKQKKDYKSILNDLRYEVHTDNTRKNAKRLLVDRVKGYVDFQISKDLFHDFNNSRNKWKLKLERADSLNHSKNQLYNTIIKEFKESPTAVEKYGYSVENFREEMKAELEILKTDEEKTSAEFEKFNELKRATVISYDYQKELLDMEFSAIYSDVDKNEFSYDEKYFAMQLLKDQNIMLPKDAIKFEYISQDKKYEFNRKYIPLWKQAEDTLTSLDIYSRTIHKLERTNTSKVSPEEIKEIIINLNSIKKLKEDYIRYLEEILPKINNHIQEISDNETLNHSAMRIKVAFLKKYSTLSENQKENINLNIFVEELKNEHEQLASEFNRYGQNQDQEKKDLSKDFAYRSKEIVSGLFNVLQSLSRTQSVSDDRKKKDRTKAFRKRGTDGREL